MQSELLKRSFCGQFYLFLDTSENFGLSEILEIRVRIFGERLLICKF